MKKQNQKFYVRKEFDTKHIKSHKPTEPDGMLIELVKLIDQENMDTLVRLYNDIHCTDSKTKAMVNIKHICCYTKNNVMITKHLSHSLVLFLRINYTKIFR